MDSHFIILLLGFIYIVLFGGLSYLRREGLSFQFAIEALIITAVYAALSWLKIFDGGPLLFLILIYVLTMRVRLLVDMANFAARRRNFDVAQKLYQIAAGVWPDTSNRLILLVNQGTMRIHQGALDDAIGLLKQVIQQSDQGFLGVRYESAAHYNLGVAYQRKGNNAQAVAEFNTVLEIWPASEYARAANNALAKHRKSPNQE